MIGFNPSPRRSIGVELELQILDGEMLMFKDSAPQVLRSLGPGFEGRIKEEFIQSMVEINTKVCLDMDEVEGDLKSSLSYLEGRLSELGAVYYSSSLHPLEKGADRNVSENPRYRRIMEDLKLVGRRFIAQGLHVHVGVESAERAIRTNNTLRIYLPLLLALTTSSPYYEGEDTGLLSYRTKLFEALPLAGLPDSLEGWEEFVRMAELLIEGGVIESVKDLWWDVRPHPDFGTVEVRVCDMPCRFREVLAIVALVQCLVETISNLHIHPEARVQMQILRSNKWQAARYGLDGVFVNPISAKKMPIRKAVEELLELVGPAAIKLGAARHLEEVRHILENGTGAHAQKRAYERTGDFISMISEVRGGFFS